MTERRCPCGGCTRLAQLDAIAASTPSAWAEPEPERPARPEWATVAEWAEANGRPLQSVVQTT
jgi:hypothetical protein